MDLKNTTFSGGLIYGTSDNLSSTNGTKIVAEMDSWGVFRLDLSGLRSNTTYYYRAYAKVYGKYYYGEIRSFTTKTGPQYDIGDFYPDDNSPFGIVFWTDATGEHGKLLSLTQVSTTWNSAFTWCKNYGSTWSLPSALDFDYLVMALADGNNLNKMNEKLRELGYDQLSGVYWSSGENDMNTTEAYAFLITYGQNLGYQVSKTKTGNGLVRAIRAF